MNNKSLDLISESFFASKVIEIAKKSKTEQEDIVILKEALKQVELIKKALYQMKKIKEGEEITFFEIPDEVGISPIAAYGRAIEIIPLIEAELGISDDQQEQCIKKFLDSIIEEINAVLTNQIILEKDLLKTRSFFREVRKRSLQESNNAFMARRQAPPWLNPPIY